MPVQARSSGEIELEHLYASAPIGLCLFDRNLRFVRINDRLAEINGISVDDHIGKTVEEVVPDLALQAREVLGHFLSGGPSITKLFSGSTPAQPAVLRHWVEHWSPVRTEDGELTGLSVAVEEVTEQKKQEERNRLLLDELQHRLQNNLGVVRAIARATLQKIDGAGVALSDFESRINALGAAHLLLRASNWERSSVGELVETVLATGGRENFQIDGATVHLTPDETMALAMVLHELGTNACKYGSLSCVGGRVAVTWKLEDEALSLCWRESGGPSVTPPTRQGFGSRLITDLVGASGECDLQFLPAGVECRIRLNLKIAPIE